MTFWKVQMCLNEMEVCALTPREVTHTPCKHYRMYIQHLHLHHVVAWIFCLLKNNILFQVKCIIFGDFKKKKQHQVFTLCDNSSNPSLPILPGNYGGLNTQILDTSSTFFCAGLFQNTSVCSNTKCVVRQLVGWIVQTRLTWRFSGASWQLNMAMLGGS